MNAFQTDSFYFKEYSLRLIFQNVVMGLMMAADKIIASLFIGVNALVATNLIGPMQLMIHAVSTLFMSGLGSYIGLLLGRGNVDKANKTASAVLLVLTAIVGLVTLGIVAFPEQIAHFAGARGDVLSLTRDYVYYVSWGFIAMVIAAGIDVLIMNDGNPSFIMRVNLASTLLNLTLNVLFVALFDMGIVGLAIATTISNSVHMLVSFVYFKRHSKVLKLVRPSIERKTLFRVLYNGTSDFLGMFSEGLKRFVINIAIITFLTPRHMEAYSIVSMFIIIFVASVFYGTALGLQPIFSKMMGAMRFERLRPLLRYSVKQSTFIALGIYLLAMPFMTTVLGYFINDPETIRIGFYLYVTFGFATLFENLPNAAIMFFTAINRPLESMVISIVRTVILLPTLTYLCIYLLGQSGLMYGTLIAELIMIVVCYVYLKAIDFSKLPIVE